MPMFSKEEAERLLKMSEDLKEVAENSGGDDTVAIGKRYFALGVAATLKWVLSDMEKEEPMSVFEKSGKATMLFGELVKKLNERGIDIAAKFEKTDDIESVIKKILSSVKTEEEKKQLLEIVKVLKSDDDDSDDIDIEDLDDEEGGGFSVRSDYSVADMEKDLSRLGTSMNEKVFDRVIRKLREGHKFIMDNGDRFRKTNLYKKLGKFYN